MIGNLSRIAFVALACAALAPDMATARTPYDGSWSVTIVTERGNCDRAYRYGVEIVDGRVVYNGGGMSGRVSANGAVSVSVSSGGAYATGSGRLSRNSGRGSWSGRSGGNACSGHWTAQRSG